jgi:hypothetical protein
MQSLSRYNVIDVMKLFMAFLVIGIHVGTLFGTDYPQVIEFVLGSAVPFFFICSGFFIQNKIINKGNNFHVLKDSCKRFLKLYILWQIVYFPLALKYLWVNGHTFEDNLQYCLRMFLFVGEIIFSWPLWYLHALIVAIIFIYILQKCRMKLIHIWVISIIMMLIGYFINYFTTSVNSNNTITAICHNIVYILGSADRNGPFRGFALVTTGMIIRKYQHYIRHEYALGSICVVSSWLLFSYSHPFHLLLLGGGLFIIAASIQIKDKPIYSTLRIHSTFIYFIHMYLVVIAHGFSKSFITNTTYVYIIWILISLISFIVSLLFNKIRKITTFQWLNHLIS